MPTSSFRAFPFSPNLTLPELHPTYHNPPQRPEAPARRGPHSPSAVSGPLPFPPPFPPTSFVAQQAAAGPHFLSWKVCISPRIKQPKACLTPAISLLLHSFAKTKTPHSLPRPPPRPTPRTRHNLPLARARIHDTKPRRTSINPPHHHGPHPPPTAVSHRRA